VTDTEPSSDSGDVALIVRRTIRASAERVFDAWTKPEHLVRWWGPRPVRCSRAEVDLRVGGGYRIANQFPDGKVLWIVGEFELVKPPHKLVYTWRLEPGTPSSERVTVRFEPRDGATEVIVVHERISSAAIRATHEQGWQGCLDGLEELLDASRTSPA
jgi:uncharacterized protein YndB with AHSA1/START domain